jgi:putative nucleotidyltransferase with HDIG domain
VPIDPLVRQIERDNTIAARLLGVARSVAHLRGSPATSVKAAVVRLGLAETRDIIFRLVMASPALRVPGYAGHAKALQEHSLLTAYLCREACRVLGFDSDLAFLCGLLHDVGKTVLLLATVKHPRYPTPPDLADLEHVLRADHAEAGALACEYWKLPAEVVSAVRAHHQPQPGDAYASAAAIADRLSHHLAGGRGLEPFLPEDARLFAALGLSAAKAQELCVYGAKVSREIGGG